MSNSGQCSERVLDRGTSDLASGHHSEQASVRMNGGGMPGTNVGGRTSDEKCVVCCCLYLQIFKVTVGSSKDERQFRRECVCNTFWLGVLYLVAAIIGYVQPGGAMEHWYRRSPLAVPSART